MARSITPTKYLTRASSVVTALPFSCAAWAKYTSFTGGLAALISIGNNSTTYWCLTINSAGGTTAIYNAGAGTTQADSGSGVGLTWQHHGATFSAGALRAIFNGTMVTTGTASAVATGNTQLGTLWSATTFTWTGDLAEAAIWNIDLTQSDWTALAAGISPLLVRPDALVAYWPLLGAGATEPDPWRAQDLTLVNAPAAAPHCRIITPTSAHRYGRAIPVVVLSGSHRFFHVLP